MDSDEEARSQIKTVRFNPLVENNVNGETSFSTLNDSHLSLEEDSTVNYHSN